jgi:NADH:ubiquinone oxidoreductase subunit E
MRAMRGKKKITKAMKKRWARYALPEGFAERGYPKDSSCHTINKIMMGHKNPRYGYQTTYKQYKYSEEQEQRQCKVCNYTSPVQHGPG